MSEQSLPRETEAKFRLRDRDAFERALADLGAHPGPQEMEINLILDDRSGSLRRRGKVLRVRQSGRQGLVTLKGARTMRAGVKSRIEIETQVEEPLRLMEIFEELGLAVCFRYEKRRTTWRFTDPDRPEVVVDETPIGLFAEIEGEDGAIRRLAAELGVDETDFLEESYVALYFAARASDPSLPPDMVFR